MVTLPSARRVATPVELALSTMFGLQPHLATILASMFAGATVAPMRTHIYKLRAALACEAIDTTPEGYRLTEVGVRECREAIAAFAEWVGGVAA